jgi:FkbM family methyltransferase
MTALIDREPQSTGAVGRTGALERIRVGLLDAFDRLLPRLALRLRADRHLRTGEPELRLVSTLSMPGRLSVDVGANHGVYAVVMARHAPRVLAVEPNPRLARLLRRGLPANCTVLACALSEAPGVAELRVPIVDGREDSYLASLSERADRPSHRYRVELRTLDDCVREPVGLLKIDVEGHEIAVLRGARRVLREDGPNLLIEAEERHRPGAVASVATLLAEHGYRGLFRDGTRLRPLAEFDPAVHQEPTRLGRGPTETEHYVNNFVFTRHPALFDRLLAEPVPAV